MVASARSETRGSSTINANLLRKWISKYLMEREKGLVPVLALHVRLSNGVELELGKAIATIDELTTLVQISGRMPCSGSTKT